MLGPDSYADTVFAYGTEQFFTRRYDTPLSKCLPHLRVRLPRHEMRVSSVSAPMSYGRSLRGARCGTLDARCVRWPVSAAPLGA